MWQDWVIGAISWAFVGTLIPTIIGRSKPSKWTSGPNALLLFLLSWVFASLNLWFAAISTGLLAFEWGVIWTQRQKPVCKSCRRTQKFNECGLADDYCGRPNKRRKR